MGKIRNRVKKFLIEEGITDISEMDVALRIRYEEYLERNETVHAPITCLRGFDRIFLHQMKEEMQTLAGRRNYTTEYRDQWICLTYYPEIEIAESFSDQQRWKGTAVGFYTGVSKKFEDADFYSIKRGDPYLQRPL